MKKLLFIICLFIVSNSVNAKVSCDDAGGIQRTGRSGNIEYCLSSQTMNWWSANSWCDAVGGTLFDIAADCSLGAAGYICPQIRGMGFPVGYLWTKNVMVDGNAIVLHSSADTIYKYSKKELSNVKALCRLK